MRKALNFAIDRQAINDTFWDGEALPEAVHGIPPYRSDHKEEWLPFNGLPYPYDPEEAKRLLAEAGYPDGFEFDYLVAPNYGGVPEGPDVAEAIAPY